MSADGFFSRWAKRKQDVREGKEVTAEPAVVPEVVPPAPVAAPAATVAPAPPPPTLEDAHTLTPESDFSRFVGADVPADVKNTALKKLFADPRFNVQDGLDVYIDDYSKPDPIPEAMLRKVVGAQFLGLFDEKKDAKEGPYEAEGKSVAQSAPEQAVTPDAHADPDLRLQQDDAPGPEGPGERPE